MVAGVGWEEGLWAGAGDETGPKVGVEESLAHEVGSFEGGGRARGSVVGDKREKSGVFEGKRGSGKGERASQTRERPVDKEENVKATLVVRGRGEIEAPSTMLGPRLEGRVKGDNKLTGGMDGMGGKVVGGTMETMVGEERGVDGRGWRWLRVSSTCRRKSCQRLGGKEMWAAEKMEITWFLAVRIARSTGLERWLKGGTYWKVRLTERKKEVRSEEVSLSREM